MQICSLCENYVKYNEVLKQAHFALNITVLYYITALQDTKYKASIIHNWCGPFFPTPAGG